MNHTTAFFNLCTCEGYGSDGGPVVRPRARPLATNLARLFSFAREKGIVVVSTRCLQGGQAPPLGPNIPRELAVIPPPSTETDACRNLSSCAEVLVERRAFPTVEEIVRARADEVFNNATSAAEDVVRTLKADQWVVFGVGCVGSAARGLLRLGKRVVVLSDATLPSTLETLDELHQELSRMGVTLETTAGFLDRFPSTNRSGSDHAVMTVGAE